MAITRRQFVTRLGALATTLGMSQMDIAKIAETFAHDTATGTFWDANGLHKPQVIWVHGAECTGCSTSLLSLFEDTSGKALANPASTLTTGGALTGIAGQLGGAIDDTADHGHRTLVAAGVDYDGQANGVPVGTESGMVNIADVLIDFISLEYHETVMGMGGDLAYQWLVDRMANQTRPFVLVVEGAIQPRPEGDTAANSWCTIGESEAGTELEFEDVVRDLGNKATAVIAIGQCACYGGYPAAVSPVLEVAQTSAMGTYEFLQTYGNEGVEDKVINVPGCPANPWWFVLTTVLWMYDVVNGYGSTNPAGTEDGPLGIVKKDLSLDATALDYGRRLKTVYGTSVHGPACPRYKDYTGGVYAQKPGDPGCLLLLGCKGTTTKSLCSLHGWNGQQPQNNDTWDHDIATAQPYGGFCTAAGHPCMGCTEKGYPDAYVPFVRL